MKADWQDHLIEIVQDEKKNQKKQVHLIKKHDSHISICGIPITGKLSDDANHFTYSKLDVTCGNCQNIIENRKRASEIRPTYLREYMMKETKRYLLGHTRNQTNLLDLL